MFKIIIFACFLAYATAKPGYLTAAPIAAAYTAPVAAAYTAPLGYSAYTAPVAAYSAYTAPVAAYSAYTAPVAAYSAYTYSSPYSAYYLR